MEEIKIVDKYMDEREFRNYVNTMLNKHNYNLIEIEDTLQDFEKEKVLNGIIVTNYYVDKDIKEEALEKNIIILDRKEFEQGIYND